MASTPFFVWTPHASATTAGDSGTVGSGATAVSTEVMPVAAPEAAVPVARPRLRRQASGSKKAPQRGLGVAELERLRVGGDSLRELTTGAGAGEAHPHGHHLFHHHLPAAAIEPNHAARYYTPVLVQPPPLPQPQPPEATICYLHPPSAGGHRAPAVHPEQQYAMDRWGRMGGFAPASNVGAGMGGGHPPHLLPVAPEIPSSQTTIWRHAPSPSCHYPEHHCDFCVRKRRASGERQTAFTPTATAAAMPGFSFFDASAMATPHQEGEEGFMMWEGKKVAEAGDQKKEPREIEFFPPSETSSHGKRAEESEFAAGAASFPASSGGGSGVQLDLSLRL